MTSKIIHRPLVKAGRKPKHPPQDVLEQVEALAADGFSKLGIAKKLAVAVDTFNRWMDEQPELKMAFDNGREAERYALHNMLYRQAMEKGNATAAMFLLKARHGYREGDQTETGNKVSINFQLPAAMTMESFKVIEYGQPDNRNQPIPAECVVVARGT